MGVIGHWRRSMLGAGGVALLLPLGLALGVALTTAFGGASTLRALGQVFVGPSAPSAPGGSSEPGLESTRDVPSVPVRANAAAPSGTAPSSSSGATVPDRSPASTDTDPSGPATTPDPDPTPVTPTQPATGTPTPPSEPPPADNGGSVVNQTGQAAADAVSALPAVGPLAGDAVQTVVDLIP